MSDKTYYCVVAAIAGVVMFLVFASVVTRQPPIHCRYVVAVRSHPGVYSCSEYPRTKP